MKSKVGTVLKFGQNSAIDRIMEKQMTSLYQDEYDYPHGKRKQKWRLSRC